MSIAPALKFYAEKYHRSVQRNRHEIVINKDTLFGLITLFRAKNQNLLGAHNRLATQKTINKDNDRITSVANGSRDILTP